VNRATGWLAFLNQNRDNDCFFTQVAIIITTSTTEPTRKADIRATQGENLEDAFEDLTPAEEFCVFI
jgi:hypothetical protein